MGLRITKHPRRLAVVLALLAVAATLHWARTRERTAIPPAPFRPDSSDGSSSRRTLRGWVGAGEQDAWTLRFAAGDPARVSIHPDQVARIRCAVQDAAGALLDQSFGSMACALGWIPPRTASYRVLVHNQDTIPVFYRLLTD